MTFQADGYFPVARDLNISQLPKGEGRYRTIASRAYYAVFLTTRELIRAQHSLGEGYKPVHRWMAENLASANSRPSGVRELGRYLLELLDLRELADYTLSASILESNAERAVEAAELAINLANTVRGDLPREAGTIDPRSTSGYPPWW